MKIATWNMERLKTQKKLPCIIANCNATQADILVLTETDARVQPDYPYFRATPSLCTESGQYYRPSENRVSVFSRHPIVKEHATYDPNTALCVELVTEHGNLIVYGTIMGIYGNRHASFRPDVEQQLADVERLAQLNVPLCICGDFNCSFSDTHYYTNWAKTTILQAFARNKIALLTLEQSACIDHIAISRVFVGDAVCEVQEWNLDKSLSDHKGIMVTLAI